MRTFVGVMSMAVLLCAPVHLAGAEPDADPSGHWEGTVEAPDKSVGIEVDLARNARGDLVGTLGSPSQGEKDLPLVTVVVSGREVRFAVAAHTGGGTFRATLRGDGQAMSGDFTQAQGGVVVPFRLTRTGAARIAPPLKSPAISKRLAGAWSGTISIQGKQRTIDLILVNQPEGSATGTLRSDGLALPVAIAETATQVRIDVPSVGGSYVGVLNAAGTQLAGTWSQRSQSLALTFRREAK